MKILPSLRDKKRYLAFEVTSEQLIYRNELSGAISNTTRSIFGDKGSSEMNVRLLSYDGKYGIIRCVNEKTRETRAVLACINSIKGSRISILVLGISGTVKGAMEKFIQKTLNNEAEQEDKIEINKNIQFQGIGGKIIQMKNIEIDILPDNPFSMETVNRSNTKYIGITVFDIKEMI